MRNWREVLIGSPLPTRMFHGERLDKVRALAALSPDALSSIAYANQEIYLGLVVAGTAGLNLSLPIALAIAALLAILTLSYNQTIIAYPNGGGSYTVATENLGKYPGLVAAAALLIDYVLTAAVSLTAGVAAIASAFPVLWQYRVETALVLLALITIANLRGLREAGTLISVPVYLFIGSYLFMLGYGLVRALIEGPAAVATMPVVQELQPITLFLVLHTFSSGCTALTGVEAISNGVSVFQPPETRNARQTMVIMAVLMAVLLLGSIGLTQYFGITTNGEETILSALARHIFGDGLLYLLVSISTLLILMVAANTSFVDFPRVTSLISKDGYLPRQLNNLGDRLVFSNGILLLAGAVAFLIIVFGGDSHALIPLFAVGVFLAFTLSQAGMVMHWMREKGKGWQFKAIINSIGALTTAVTFVVVAVSKFLDGAWIIAVLIPVLMYGFLKIHEHYDEIRPQLSLKGYTPPARSSAKPRVVIPVSGVHRGTLHALNFARSLSDNVTALYIEIDPAQTERFREEWTQWCPDTPLEVVESPYRSILLPLLAYLDHTDRQHDDGQHAILVMPEFIPGSWWQHFLHNQTAWMIRMALLYQRRRHRRGRVIIEVPFLLEG
ncbi:MAG: APC family permease [Anaerolineae bacterium]